MTSESTPSGLPREAWLDLARKLDWEYSYVSEDEVFPESEAGWQGVPREDWRQWDEPYRTSFQEYVRQQADKEQVVRAVVELLCRPGVVSRLDPAWVNALKLHGAALALAEFAACIGNLRAAR